jgi:hypothetical protein
VRCRDAIVVGGMYIVFEDLSLSLSFTSYSFSVRGRSTGGGKSRWSNEEKGGMISLESAVLLSVFPQSESPARRS